MSSPTPPPDAERLLTSIELPTREPVDLRCSLCGAACALATGVCTSCGHDELGYFDDMPEIARLLP